MHRRSTALAITALLALTAGCSSSSNASPAPMSTFSAAGVARFNQLMALTPIGPPDKELASAEQLCSELRAGWSVNAAMGEVKAIWGGPHGVILGATAVGTNVLCPDQEPKVRSWIVSPRN